jgi:hypothetical protein
MKLIQKIAKETQGEVSPQRWDKTVKELMKAWPHKSMNSTLSFTLGTPQGNINYRLQAVPTYGSGYRPVVSRLFQIPFTTAAVPAPQQVRGIALPNQPNQATATMVGLRWEIVGTAEAFAVMRALLQEYEGEAMEEDEEIAMVTQLD